MELSPLAVTEVTEPYQEVLDHEVDRERLLLSTPPEVGIIEILPKTLKYDILSVKI